MLSACSYVYADKFTITACVQNVRIPNARMHRNGAAGMKINGAYYRDRRAADAEVIASH